MCIRQERGFCGITYTAAPNYNIGPSDLKAKTGTMDCKQDYTVIPGGHNGDNNVSCSGHNKSIDKHNTCNCVWKGFCQN